MPKPVLSPTIVPVPATSNLPVPAPTKVLIPAPTATSGGGSGGGDGGVVGSAAVVVILVFAGGTALVFWWRRAAAAAKLPDHNAAEEHALELQMETIGRPGDKNRFTNKEAPNSGRQDIGIYVGDREPGHGIRIYVEKSGHRPGSRPKGALSTKELA